MPPSDRLALSGRRVWVAGHGGMVGSAIVRQLKALSAEVLTVDRAIVDLRRQTETEEWMAANRPEIVVLAAAKVGGIAANSAHPAEFIYDNLAIEMNIMEGARRIGVRKLLFLGSSCIYPKHAPQPMAETALLTGPLEPTNQWYAIAKIAGIKLAQAFRREYASDFISVMPTNLYGPGDHFDLETSHVIPAILHKAHVAKIQRAPTLEIWGSGTPRREFLFVEDLAKACIMLLERYSDEEHINVGAGEDLTIRELAELIQRVVEFEGTLTFNSSRPDGTPRKLLDTARMRALGWRPETTLEDGLRRTYRWFLANQSRQN